AGSVSPCARSISRGNVGACVTDDCHAFGVGLQDAILTKRSGLWCAGPYPQKRYPRPAHRGPLGRSVTIFSSMIRRLFSSESRLAGLMGCSIFMFYHPLNVQKRRETIRSRRGFIGVQWLCCSTFAPKSHPSNQKGVYWLLRSSVRKMVNAPNVRRNQPE